MIPKSRNLRILAKPKYGNGNLINDRLYREIELDPTVSVLAWSPMKMLFCRYDILHMHWPDNVLRDQIWLRSAFKVLFLIGAILWIRLAGKKLVWTAHNVVSHDGYHPKLEAVFWRFFIPTLDGIIALSEESLKHIQALRCVPDRTFILVVPHGNYCGVYQDTISKAQARECLGLPLDGKVVLHLGLIRRYKKVEILIELARVHENVQILIAGKVLDEDYRSELRILAEGLPNVHLHLKFIPNEELQRYLRASDLFVLPYDKITNSGSAVLALSFDLPIVAPDLPCFESLRSTFGERWVSTYTGKFKSELVLARLNAVDLNRSPAKVEWDTWAWPLIANKVNGLYKSVWIQ